MAKNTLVSQDALNSLEALLVPPRFELNSESGLGRFSEFSYKKLSESYLQKDLESRFQKNPLWEKARPLVLGSWARGELCPKSDLDVIFMGPQEVVAQFVSELQAKGLKLRSRWVEHSKDLLEGVEAFDILNLLQAKAMYSDDEFDLSQVQKKVLLSKAWRKKIISAVARDRRKRRVQFDSLSNLLEPHLKNSPGGLRDIEQVFQLYPLCAERFQDNEGKYALQVLSYAKQLFLQLRWELHLQGLDDHLVSTAQLDISKKYKFKKSQDFMREVSRTFSRAHFYSDWFFERISRSPSELKRVERAQFAKPEDALKLLRRDPSVLMQAKIRVSMDQVCRRISGAVRGRMLKEVLMPKTPASLTQAVFRSRLIDHLCPQIRPLIGYVQHDQYHRWTADRHLMQACLETKEIFAKPRLLFGLKKWHREMTFMDWEILGWTSLFHDLAKGQAQDHSDLGEVYVRQELKKFGVKKQIIEEVSFLVRHHLALSVAAFRKNPQDEKTWKDFWQLGMTDARVRRLALFTVVDIRATHPQAWTSWKAQLLTECVSNLLSPEKREYFALREQSKSLFGAKRSNEVAAGLDLQTLKTFSMKSLMKDFSEVSFGAQKNIFKLLKDRSGRPWVRFYQQKDELGLVENFVRSLFEAGINVEQALIQTLPGLGVYDLFQISKRSLKNVKRLQLLDPAKVSRMPTIVLQEIELVSQSETEAIISFRGLDARGLLWGLTHRMKELDLFILKARVHTWGGQVEDLIHVRPIPELEAKIEELRRFFVPVPQVQT